jgi:hypothetical protein
MLNSDQPAEALAQIKEIQIVVEHQYDEVREYVAFPAHHEALVRVGLQRLL